MSEEKLVPKLRFIDESDNWNLFKLGEVLDKKGYIRGPFGSALKRGEMKKEGIPVYEQQHAIYNNRIFRYYIDNDKFQELKRFQVFPNDLIVSCSGTIGKTSLITNNDEKGIISQALLILRSNSNIINPKFLKYFLETNSGYNSLISSAGGSSQVNIAKKQIILDIPLLIPNLETQSKIISFLDLINNKIELLEEKHKYYQDFKKYLMQKLFAQELRFNFNDAWKTVKIKDIFDERSEKGFLDLELLSVTLNDGVIKRSEIESKDNSNENKSNYKHVLPGDIVYNSMRMWQGASGVSPYEGIVSPAYTILIPKNVYSKYFGYYFKTNEMVYQFKKYSQGLTSDTWNLKYPLISEIKIKIPSIEEQKEITNVFEIMDEKIKILQNNIDELTTFKKGLLQQMFVVRINWRCNFKLAKSPSFNKHLLILKNKIIFIIIK